MKKLNWGIIGNGTIAEKFVTGLLAVDCTVLGNTSRNRENSQRFANLYQIPHVYDSVEELAQNPEIDAIYIGVPNQAHYPAAKICLEHGKHVLCEKPFTMNEQEASDLITLAKERNLFLMEAMWTKFLPVIQEVRRLIQSGVIGNVTYAEAAFGYYYPKDANHRLYRPDMGGGALLDVGIYPIDLVLYLLDRKPDKIQSQAVIGSFGVDEVNTIEFLYGNPDTECIAVLKSAIQADQGDGAVIMGTKGKVVIPEFYHADIAYLYDNQGQLQKTIQIPHRSNGYEYEAMETARCIEQGTIESDTHPLSTTLFTTQLMDDLRKEWGVVYPTDKKGTSK